MLLDRFAFRLPDAKSAEFAACFSDPIHAEAKVGEQFFTRAMLGKLIGNTQAANARRVESCIVDRFEDGAAEATYQLTFFDRYKEP